MACFAGPRHNRAMVTGIPSRVVVWTVAALLPLLPATAPAAGAGAGAPPGRALGSLAGSGGESVAFSRDGRLILTAGPAAARVWDAATLRPVTPPLAYRGSDPGENGTGSAEFSP